MFKLHITFKRGRPLKKALVIMILYCGWTTSAQPLVFSPDSSRWNQHTGYWNGAFGNIYYHYYYSSYILHGDTNVNGKLLQKLYAAGVTNKIDTVCETLYAYLFNDSNRIYEGPDPDSMTLIFDYNLTKGDSFSFGAGVIYNNQAQPQTYYPKVDSITSIYYAGRMRKWIRFTSMPYGTQVIWVEGVGDIKYGLVWNYFTIMFFNYLNTSLSGFNCFFDGGNKTMHGNCLYTQCTQVDTKYSEQIRHFRVYPNPTSDKLVIESENILSTEIFDPLGKKLLVGYSQYLDLSDLSGGIYLLKVETTQGTLTHKIVIQR